MLVRGLQGTACWRPWFFTSYSDRRYGEAGEELRSISDAGRHQSARLIFKTAADPYFPFIWSEYQRQVDSETPTGQSDGTRQQIVMLLTDGTSSFH